MLKSTGEVRKHDFHCVCGRLGNLCLRVWAHVLTLGVHRVNGEKRKSKFLYAEGGHDQTDHLVRCIHSTEDLLTPLRLLHFQTHEYLNAPLPLCRMTRLTPFIRVIRGLESSQRRSRAVWHSRAMVTIQLAASVFAPSPPDLRQ